MTAWWTDMSTTGNIMPVPRQLPLLLRQWRLRPPRGVASAAKGTPSKRGFDGIPMNGEQVRRLRTSCTGQKPVHFFLNVAAGALLAAAPLSPAHAAPAPAQPVRVGQSVDD